jgi:peptidoglycan/LPS O-acetylase OafA/YrhL
MTNTLIPAHVSAFLNRVRWVAALLVVLGHVRVHVLEASAQFSSDAWMSKLLVFFSGFGRGAVIIFFVISGYLVGGSLLSRSLQSNTFKRYAVDRLTRLYVVLVPTLLLTWLLAYWQCHAGMQCFSKDTDWSLSTLFGNLMFQQGIRFENWGGNYPLWSLANEFLYYLAFPIILIACKVRWRYRWPALVMLVLVLLIMGGQVVALFPIWLMGVAARYCWPITVPRYLAIILMIVTLGLKRLYPGSAFEVLQDHAIGISFFLWLCALDKQENPILPASIFNRFDKWAADWSFTLYAAHVPILATVAWVMTNKLEPLALDTDKPKTWFVYIVCLLGTLIACYVLSLMTEKHTTKIRKLFSDNKRNRNAMHHNHG